MPNALTTVPPTIEMKASTPQSFLLHVFATVFVADVDDVSMAAVDIFRGFGVVDVSKCVNEMWNMAFYSVPGVAILGSVQL